MRRVSKSASNRLRAGGRYIGGQREIGGSLDRAKNALLLFALLWKHNPFEEYARHLIVSFLKICSLLGTMSFLCLDTPRTIRDNKRASDSVPCCDVSIVDNFDNHAATNYSKTFTR